MKVFTQRMRRFCREYIIDNDGTAAAIRSGYAKRGAASRACEMLKSKHVIRRIEELRKEQHKRLDIRADDVLSELMRISMSSAADIFDEHGEIKPINEIPREVLACVRSIKRRIDKNTGLPIFEFSFWDKTKTLETLCRHLGLLQDNTNVRFPDGIPDELKAMSEPEIDDLIRQEAKRLDN
jgi:phage terminase small subunit